MSGYPNQIPRLLQMAEEHDALTQKLVRVVVELPSFAECTGSISTGKHHFGAGGLQYHIGEVANLCRLNRFAVAPDIPANQALLAAIYHDVGKLWDYERIPDLMGLDLGWQETPHKRHINHVNRSALYWDQQCRAMDAPADLREHVLHAILAHHANFGSSVMPKTKLAWLLHLCDAMSAWMNQCDRREPQGAT